MSLADMSRDSALHADQDRKKETARRGKLLIYASIEELESDTNMYPEAPENGIYIFPEDAEVGADAIKALGRDDVVFEYDIMSPCGLLQCCRYRKGSGSYVGKPFSPVVTETGNGEDVNDYVKVTVENTELCPRYCARVVKNIKIGPSPG